VNPRPAALDEARMAFGKSLDTQLPEFMSAGGKEQEITGRFMPRMPFFVIALSHRFMLEGYPRILL
jgi:hypothetical protein